MNITSKIAIVTGASRGIGTAFCKALVRKGAVVYGLARSEGRLNKIQETLGDAFIPVTMDITSHDDIEDWIGRTFEGDNKPDILINNAGLGRFGNIEDLSREDWHAMIETNLSGIFYMTRQVVPLMKQNNNTCHIVNIASIAGKIGTPRLSGYNASKFGVRGFSESLFKELRYDGIKVTSFCPGSIATEFFEDAEGVKTHSNMMQPDDVAKVLIDLLETPDNFLINDITMRPLNPKPPEEE